MLAPTKRWMVIAVMATAVKTVLAMLAITSYDFVNYVHISSLAYTSFGEGRIPFLNVYTFPAVLLAPFYALSQTYRNPSVAGFLLIFSLKLPLILFDFVTGILILLLVREITGSTSAGRFAFLVWYLNPYNTYATEMWGSIEIIAAALLLVAVFLTYKRSWLGSGFSLAIATMFRFFPLFLLPVFLLCSVRDGRKATLRFLLSYLCPIASIFSVLAFAPATGYFSSLSVGLSLGSPGDILRDLSAVILNQPYLLRFLGMPVSSSKLVSVFPGALPIALFLYPIQFYMLGKVWRREESLIINLCLAFLLIHFTASIHEPYQFTWVTPLLTVYYCVRRDCRWLLAYTFLFAFLAALSSHDIFSSSTSFFFIPLLNGWLSAASAWALSVNDVLVFFEPFLYGIFYGLKAGFLAKVNMQAIGPAPPKTGYWIR